MLIHFEETRHEQRSVNESPLCPTVTRKDPPIKSGAAKRVRSVGAEPRFVMYPNKIAKKG